MKIKAKDILPFLGFFLITIGNGKYLGAKFGDLIEYLGIVVLLILCYWPSKTNHVSITETIKVLLLTLLLSIGAFYKRGADKSLLYDCFDLICIDVVCIEVTKRPVYK